MSFGVTQRSGATIKVCVASDSARRDVRRMRTS
jgi:hypothetical protein